MSASPSSLRAQVERLTSDHTITPGEPPGTGAASPLEEILLAEAAAALPAPLRWRLVASDLDRAADYQGAAALFRWIQHDPAQARVFLDHLDRHGSKSAGFALARALVAQPPQPACWRRLDAAGLCLELAGVLLALMARVALFRSLSHRGPLLDVPPDGLGSLAVAALWPHGLFGPGARWGTVGLLLAIGWLALEATLLPRAAGRLRGWPLQRRGLPSSPPRWRLDTFTALWQTLALGPLLYVAARTLAVLAQPAPWWLRLMSVLFTLLILGRLLSAAWSTLCQEARTE